jgi:aerobic carbon-monoxide dehydrogenase medium subunit
MPAPWKSTSFKQPKIKAISNLFASQAPKFMKSGHFRSGRNRLVNPMAAGIAVLGNRFELRHAPKEAFVDPPGQAGRGGPDGMEVATRGRANCSSRRLREGGVSGLGEQERVAQLVVGDPLGIAGRRLAVHRSRKRIASFRLHLPSTITEAAALLAERRGACVIAGGIDVINRMKGGAMLEDAVFVGRLEPLRRIEVSRTALHIGAGCTHHEFAVSPIAIGALQDLCSTWGTIANQRIRFKGTVGGNLMAREHGYEGPQILSAAGAELDFVIPEGTRTISCLDYFTTPPSDTAWLLEAIRVPCGHELRLIYDRSLKGVAGVVLALRLAGDLVESARAAVTWAYRELHCTDLQVGPSVPLSALRSLAGTLASSFTAALPQPITDHVASCSYRRRIIEVQLRRALERAGREQIA